MKKRKTRKKIFFLLGILFTFVLVNLLLEGKLVEPVSNLLKDLTVPFFSIQKVVQKEGITYDKVRFSKEQEMRKELKDLKKTLQLNQTLGEVDYTNASTIYRNVEYWNETITVDKGSHDGIRKGMPVVTNGGLIGRVIQTSEFTSTIELLCIQKINKISVKIQVGEEYIYGLLNGYDENTKLFQIEGISTNIEIPEGSVVTTTGMGEFYPSGILVGVTSTVHNDHFDLSKVVDMKSDVVFDDIRVVTILKRKDLGK